MTQIKIDEYKQHKNYLVAQWFQIMELEMLLNKWKYDLKEVKTLWTWEFLLNGQLENIRRHGWPTIPVLNKYWIKYADQEEKDEFINTLKKLAESEGRNE